MAQPKYKFGKGSISLAVFESVGKGGSPGFDDFYSLQKSKKVNDQWVNENILLSVSQLKDVKDLIEQALKEGA